MPKKNRCDKCGKWVKDLYCLPEALFWFLESDNEYAICNDCSNKFTIDEWKKWITEKRGNMAQQRKKK